MSRSLFGTFMLLVFTWGCESRGRRSVVDNNLTPMQKAEQRPLLDRFMEYEREAIGSTTADHPRLIALADRVLIREDGHKAYVYFTLIGKENEGGYKTVTMIVTDGGANSQHRESGKSDRETILEVIPDNGLH